MQHFKNHAMSILRDCNEGRQRCGECPFLECTDNGSTLAGELKRRGLDSLEIEKRFDRDRHLAERARRRGMRGD